MSRLSTHRTATKAFTLVELLVVIGIIAVLISILLPSLARARQAALTVSCLANMKQIGQALYLYEMDNKHLPYGAAGGTAAHDTWWHAVSNTVGVQTRDAAGNWVGLSKVLQCPGVASEFVGTPYPGTSVADNLIFNGGSGFRADYMCNIRAMPLQPEGAANRRMNTPLDTVGPWTHDWLPMQTSNIKDGSSKMIVWEGPNFKYWNNNPNDVAGTGLSGRAKGWVADGAEWNGTFPCSFSLMGWMPYFWGWGLSYELDSWADIRGTGWLEVNAWSHTTLVKPGEGPGDALGGVSVADIMASNRDGMGLDAGPNPAGADDRAGWQTNMRYRHNNDTTMTALFADGHAEARKIGEVYCYDIMLDNTN